MLSSYNKAEIIEHIHCGTSPIYVLIEDTPRYQAGAG
jgi:hypothetical protein